MRGYIDAFHDSAVVGWAATTKWQRFESLTLYVDGQPVSSTRDAVFREDLAKAGYGDGMFGYRLPVASPLRDGRSHKLAVRCVATDKTVGWIHSSLVLHSVSSEQTFGHTPTSSAAHQARPLASDHAVTRITPVSAGLQGRLDRVSSAGAIGWVRNENDPRSRLTVELLANGNVIGSLRADRFRADLVAAGKGDGRHAFRFLLPDAVLDGKEYSFDVRVRGTESYLNSGPTSFQQPTSRPYRNVNEYLRWSLLNREVRAPFVEEDLRVLGYMDWYASKLSSAYLDRDQDDLVSVIMPAYNRADVIASAIDSVLAQSYSNLELLVIDDGSTDQTADVAGSTADERVRVIRMDQNSGASAARNVGQRSARGRYFAYLDTDNTWRSNFLLLMVNTLREHPDARSVYCAQRVVELDKSPDTQNANETLRFGPFHRALLENRNYIDNNVFVHERSLWQEKGGYDERLRRLVDWDLILRYTEDTAPIALPCILMDYYHGKVDNQISNTEPLQDAEARVRHKLGAGRNRSFTLPLKADEELSVQHPEHSFFSASSVAVPPTRCPAEPASASRPVSIIIPSFQAEQYLAYCIDSLLSFTSPGTFEIIVVDNGSDEGVLRRLDRYCAEHAYIRLIKNRHNVGFTYAVNQGIEAAAAESDIVLLNNDAVVTHGWLTAMQLVVSRDESVGIVAPRQTLLPRSATMRTHVPSCNEAHEMCVSVSAHHDNVVIPNLMDTTSCLELDFVPFFCVYISRDCLNRVGLLDAKNGRHYRSDRIYCDAVRLHAGMKIIYTPHSKLYHFLQRSTSELKQTDKAMYRRMFVDNRWDEDEARQHAVFSEHDRRVPAEANRNLEPYAEASRDVDVCGDA